MVKVYDPMFDENIIYKWRFSTYHTHSFGLGLDISLEQKDKYNPRREFWIRLHLIKWNFLFGYLGRAESEDKFEKTNE